MIFRISHSKDLNKIVEATALVNPYDIVQPPAASQMEIWASWGRCKLIAVLMETRNYTSNSCLIVASALLSNYLIINTKLNSAVYAKRNLC